MADARGNHAGALAAWRSLLGEGNVLEDPATLAAAETATFATDRRVLALIRPGTRAEVQECVRIANQFKTPLYPVSRGRNWGFGSRVPTCDGSVILDLGRLNRILDFSEEMAYITVEAGVSFRQIHEFLRGHNSNLFLSVIGGPASASLIGNVVERGDGTGPYGERLDHVTGLEVVLPTGALVHTGFGRFGGAATTHVDRRGVGPHTDGLFTQSNLGIVTALTAWLRPLPEDLVVFTCRIGDTSRLNKLVDGVRRLALRDILQSHCFSIWNGYKALAREIQFPWETTRGLSPLRLTDVGMEKAWFGCGALYGASHQHALADKQAVGQALGGLVEEIEFFDLSPEAAMSVAGVFVGVPSDENLKSVYWRKRIKPPLALDPDHDRCGVIWLCPALPLDGNAAEAGVRLIESTIEHHGFEPNIGMSCASGRSLYVFVAIIYDREVDGEDRRAMNCHDELVRQLVEGGYIPCRLGIHSMGALPAVKDDFGFFLSSLKRALDPGDVLAPGRYDFRKDWPNRDP